MNFDALYTKVLARQPLSVDEGLLLYQYAPTQDLIFLGHQLRNLLVPNSKVTWQIDRNVNITNGCISGCRFCNFHCAPNSKRQFITTLEQYREKIDELHQYGGNQLLLQGGLHPALGLNFYQNLFSELKAYCPSLVLHALGPPEIAHIAKLENMSYGRVLRALQQSGLDSLPGAGAEILVNRVRRLISPAKPSVRAWVDVMREAHKLGLITSATMMIGHVETLRERIEHLVLIRDIQSRKPANSPGFLNFVVWTFQGSGTQLASTQAITPVTDVEYLRTVAISRIMLPNIANIQASWLTVGPELAQICLHAGANDLGSIMIEENVVSAAGAHFRMDAHSMQKTIVDAGFVPQLRNQRYQAVDLPPCPFSKIYPVDELKNEGRNKTV